MPKSTTKVKRSIEERLAKLETEMAQLTACAEHDRTTKHSTAGDLLQHVRGVFDNDPDFGEVVEFGRQWRKSSRSQSKTGKAKNARARH